MRLVLFPAEPCACIILRENPLHSGEGFCYDKEGIQVERS